MAARVHLTKTLGKPRLPGNHRRLARYHSGAANGVGGNQLGRPVARADVLGQGAGDVLGNQMRRARQRS